MNILLRLFGDVRFSHSELNSSGYPPILIRRFLCDSVVIELVREFWEPGLYDAAAKALKLSRSEVEHAFAEIMGQEVSIEGLKTAFSQDTLSYVSQIEDHWNSKLAKKLQRFSYEF